MMMTKGKGTPTNISDEMYDPGTPQYGIAAALLCTTGFIALFLPNVTGDPHPRMTHYMGVLGSNQPWNVLLFMGTPVVLAEAIAVSELSVLFTQGKLKPWVLNLNKYCGIALGPYFFGIFVYLMKNAVIPLTANAIWHGPADVVAVFTYLFSVVPLVGMTLIELNILGRSSARDRMRLHAIFVGIFLITVHIAMVVGMFDPLQWGWAGMPGVTYD